MIEIDLKKIEQIAVEAGEAILEIYNEEFEVNFKDDNSPLTKADLKSNEIICEALKKLYPTIEIMSEEDDETQYEVRKCWKSYWCIDPLDGTKEFVKRNGEFTVNIALMQDNRPVLGVVYAPVLKDMYSAKKGVGAFKNGIQIVQNSSLHVRDKYVVVASNSHMNDETKKYIEELKKTKDVELVNIGSSLKFCLVAEGVADEYPRFAPTMEWDSAAAHSVLLECGKNIISVFDNEELKYNKKSLVNSGFIVRHLLR
ncbi:MAG: 3'(2'),5'-bisphosphate nucleotidase CysQ [Campylobacterota bacterium]|nr:3'(2'),5'-bisphosphate nucleotidase CysQ [Campylobacterota bacterium]